MLVGTFFLLFSLWLLVKGWFEYRQTKTIDWRERRPRRWHRVVDVSEFILHIVLALGFVAFAVSLWLTALGVTPSWTIPAESRPALTRPTGSVD